MKIRRLAILALASAIAAVSLGAVTAEPASANTSRVVRSDGCDYDGHSQSVVYGRSVATMSSVLSTCKYTVYVNGTRACSYLRLDAISSRASYFDNRLYLQRTGSHYRPMSVSTPTYSSSSWCAGEYRSITVTYGADLKLVRSFAKDLYASPRITLQASADQTYLENVSQIWQSGTWTLWT